MMLHEEFTIRYPYLITPLDGMAVQPDIMEPVHEHTATSLLLEDVDMEDLDVNPCVSPSTISTSSRSRPSSTISL
jgi:hypothetical protein